MSIETIDDIDLIRIQGRLAVEINRSQSLSEKVQIVGRDTTRPYFKCVKLDSGFDSISIETPTRHIKKWGDKNEIPLGVLNSRDQTFEYYDSFQLSTTQHSLYESLDSAVRAMGYSITE